MDDSERTPLTAREKKIVFSVLLLTLLVLGLWIFTIIMSLPEPSHGLV